MPHREDPPILPRSTRTRPPRRWRRGITIRLAIVATIVLLFWMTGCMERLFYVPTREATPPPIDLPGTEIVRFDSADGTRLCGWFVPAAGRQPGDSPAPTILHVHGNAGSIKSHIWFTEFLAPAGFNVFIFDYRGYGESEGSAWKRGPLIADANAALDALLLRDDVDGDRIGIYGQSLGGAIGLNVFAERDEITAAVVESAFASWRLAAATALSNPPNFLARGLAAVLIADHHRPDEVIAGIDRPILILHGDADTIIPVSHGRLLAEAAGDAATLVEFPGGDHNDLRLSHPEMEQLVVEFYRRHLPPQAP